MAATADQRQADGSPLKFSQNAQQDLRSLFGHRVMPKIAAALDQLATTPSTAVTAWRHLDVEDYQILYRPVRSSSPCAPSCPATATYLVASVARSRTPGPQWASTPIPAMTTRPPPIDTTRPAQPRADRVVVSTTPGRTGT